MSQRNRRGKNRPANQAVPIDGSVLSPLPGAVIAGLATRQVSYSGPVPPPQFMREFNEIIPGAAERILAMAEAQTSHRIAIEAKAVNSGNMRATLGTCFGFIIGMTALIIGGAGMFTGHETTGFWFGVSGLGSLVGVFIVGRYAGARERAEKSRQIKRR